MDIYSLDEPIGSASVTAPKNKFTKRGIIIAISVGAVLSVAGMFIFLTNNRSIVKNNSIFLGSVNESESLLTPIPSKTTGQKTNNSSENKIAETAGEKPKDVVLTTSSKVGELGAKTTIKPSIRPTVKTGVKTPTGNVSSGNNSTNSQNGAGSNNSNSSNNSNNSGNASGTQQQTDDTSNWKTVSNQDYGYTLKYPVNWVIKNTVNVGSTQATNFMTLDNQNEIIATFYINNSGSQTEASTQTGFKIKSYTTSDGKTYIYQCVHVLDEQIMSTCETIVNTITFLK
jgi:hypothetical protein